jgi:hypothetical protein
LSQSLAVEDDEAETELNLHLPLPLEAQTGGTNYEHSVGSSSGMQFAQNQASLNGLTQTNIVGDEKARAGQGKSHLDGNKLVVFMTNGRQKEGCYRLLTYTRGFKEHGLVEESEKG